MADEHTAGAPAVGRRPAANGANGTRPSREEVIADLARIAANEGKAESKPEPEAKAEEPAERSPAHAQHGLDDAEPEETDEPEERQEEPDDSKADEEQAKADPDLAKRLAIVAKHEKRAKEREAQAKAAIEQERATLRREREQFEREIQSQRAEIESFGKLKARAKYDAAGALRALGLGEDDLGPAARQLWAHSKEGQQDPKVSREAAERLMREREAEDRITRLERELEESKKAARERETTERVQRQVEQYLDGITKAITEEHPLARRLIEKSPSKAKLRLGEVAQMLADRDGELPDAEDVLAEYERRRRAELEDDGVDVATMLKPKAKAKRADDAPRTLGADIGTTTAPKGTERKKTALEKRAELEAELRAMDLKGR